MDQVRNDDTRAAMTGRGWITDLALVDLAGANALLVSGELEGQTFTTYVGSVPDGMPDPIGFLLDGLPGSIAIGELATVADVDAMIDEARRTPGLETFTIQPHMDGAAPEMTMVAPGVGRVRLQVDESTLEHRLARLRHQRRRDAEGRTLTRFGAMSLAIAARDIEDLERIIDTAFAADDVTYRGVEIRITQGSRVRTTVRSATMMVLPDGIEIIDLPDTIKLALRSGDLDGEPLSRVVDIAGFDGLRIARINRQTTVNRLTAGGGGEWIKIHVRDEHLAQFEDLEIEEAREAAHHAFERRREAIGL